MKLLITPTSPYARKARVVALEKNLPVEVKTVDPWRELRGVADINPLNKIPILYPAGESAAPIFDSPVICEYLDSQSDSPKLLPESPAARIAVKNAEGLADGIMDAAAAVIIAGRIAGVDAVPQKWRDWQLDKVRRTLAHFNGEYQNRGGGEALHLGDIALGCALGFVDFRLPDIKWRDENPALVKWFAAVSARDSFLQTAPPTS